MKERKKTRASVLSDLQSPIGVSKGTLKVVQVKLLCRTVGGGNTRYLRETVDVESYGPPSPATERKS